MLELVRKIMGKKIEPTVIPKQFEPSETLADITKARVLLDWNPKVDLEEGLRRTING
jgi:nucleoside-diphosphate-sugar epimerase